MRLNKRNETAHLAQGYDCAGSKIQIRRFKQSVSEVQRDCI